MTNPLHALAALYAYLHTAEPWTAAPGHVFIADCELRPMSIAEYMEQARLEREKWERGRISGKPRRLPSAEEVEGNALNYVCFSEISSLGD